MEVNIDLTKEEGDVSKLIAFGYTESDLENTLLAAREARDSAEDAKDAAQASESSASASASTATTQAGTATAQAAIATTQASNASVSASSASSSASTATTQAGIATTKASDASTSASNAASSASTATTQASNASNSATAANNSAIAAAASELAAETAETNAETAEVAAESAQSSAESAQASAESAETSALASQAAALASQQSATASANSASSSAASASSSATDAQSSEDDAETSATAAANSATASANSASASSTSASNAASSAAAASTSASSALASKNAAATSETNADLSANTATIQASVATTQAGIATTKANEASASASEASTSETNASASASTATTQASNAASSASAASTSASNASTSATSASTSANNASASASSASASLATFQGQYTSSTTEPSGGVEGELWFDETQNVMKVHDGSSFVAAYVSLGGALISVNNLDDLDNVSTARTNLDVYSQDQTDTLLDAKVNNSQVLTNVPIGALFTDTLPTKADIDALNVDADTLDGQEGAYYRNATNINAGTINDARLPSTISSNTTGNAATATTATTASAVAWTAITGKPSTFTPSSHTHDYLPLSGGTVTGSTRFSNVTNYFGGTASNTAEIWMQTSNAGSPQIGLTDNQGDMSWAIGGDDADNSFKIHGVASGTIPTINNLVTPWFELTTGGTAYLNGNTVYHSGNVPTWNQDTTGNAATATNADTLDGNDSTYFYPASNPNGYTTNVGDITGVTAGSGISGGGTSGTVTISHADTSSQASSNNSGRTYIQDITLDTYGHITGIGTATETVVNTWRGIDDTPVNGQTSESISSNWAYDHQNSSTAHPRDTRNQVAGTYNTIIGTDTDINTSGATIIDNIYVTDGVITSMGTRNLTAADLGISDKLLNIGFHSWDTYTYLSIGSAWSTDSSSTFTYTPVSNNSTLYVEVIGSYFSRSNYSGIALFKNGSPINISSASGNRNAVHASVNYETYAARPVSFTVKINNTSTSSISFSLALRNRYYSGVQIVGNRAGYHTSDPDTIYNVSSVSTIKVLEIKN